MHVEYRIDSGERIGAVALDWSRFAAENGAAGLTRETVLSRSLWDFVVDIDVQRTDQLLFGAVRSTEKRASAPLRCDSPPVRRFMELHCSPLAGERIGIEAILVKQEPPPTRDSDESSDRELTAWMRVWSWCKRINLGPAGWAEIDETMRWFLEAESQRTTHGICPDCERRVNLEIARLRAV